MAFGLEDDDGQKIRDHLFWSSEDNAFVAEVPELPGCMADGKTYREALANAEQIIEEWIENATKLDSPIPQPKGRLVYA